MEFENGPGSVAAIQQIIHGRGVPRANREVVISLREWHDIFVPHFVQKPVSVELPFCGIAVLESHHAPGFVPSKLKHHFAKFIFVIDGHGKMEVDGNTFIMKRNAVFHVLPETIHKIEDVGSPVSLYALAYRTDVIPRTMYQRFVERGVFYCWLTGLAGHTADYFRLDIREMLFEQDCKREGWEMVMQSRLGDFFVRALRMMAPPRNIPEILFEKNHASSERVSAYALRLESRFFMNESLDEAARGTGLSRRQFTGLFRKITGQSWLERLRHLRLIHAQKLLVSSNKPVISVAFECGFDDLSHFHRVFKRKLGCSPMVFRERKTKRQSA